MNIDNLTLKQIREASGLISPQTAQAISDKPHPFEIGENYFVRSVTHYYTGRLIEVFDTELVLEDVAWIADTGRYADALKSGDFSEVEPYPSGSVILGRGAILDAAKLSTSLPLSQK